MGVRINAYAIDLPVFDAFLDTTLGDLLLRYHRDGKDPNQRLMFTGVDSDDSFFANPGGSVGYFTGNGSDRHLEELTTGRIHQIAALQTKAREHLSNGTNYQAAWLLRGFSNCRGIDFIEQLLDGQRLPWIGSVLQFAHNYLERGEYEKLECLFRRTLRGATCGYKIPKGDIGLIVAGLPFSPELDIELRFGRWSKEEAFDAAALLSKLMELSPTFTPPPQLISFYPADSEWHEWVQLNVKSLLKIRDLKFGLCNILTFLG